MYCNMPKDEDGKIQELLYRRRQKMHDKIPLTDFERQDFLVCDGQFHWIFYGETTALTKYGANKSFSEAIREKCPDFVHAQLGEMLEREAVARKTFANFKPQPVDNDAVFSVKRWMKDGPRNLVISGGAGRGKTHLAIAVQVEALRDLKRTVFTSAEDLEEAFLAAMPTAQTYDEEARQLILDMKNSDLVILDDLGSERSTETAFFPEQLKKILNEMRGRLLITSNLSRSGLESKYPETIISRIFESCLAVHLRGKDYRLTKGAK